MIKYLKRSVAFFAILSMALFFGCSRIVEEKTEKRIAASFFPVYTLAMNIVKGVPDLTLVQLIQPQDGCLRSYQLSEWDASLMSGYDALILGGRGLESFESMFTTDTPSLPVIVAMDGLTLLNDGKTITDDDASHYEYENPWLFLSPAGAAEICTSIAEGMIQLDPEHKTVYEENLTDVTARLNTLSESIKRTASALPKGNVAVMHEGLKYLTDLMELTVTYTDPREPGTSPEGNEIAELIEQLKTNQVQVVLLESQAPMPLREYLAEAGYEIALIDTLSTHAADGNSSAYENIMLNNAKNISDAFNRIRFAP